MAFAPGDPVTDERLARLRRVRRVALALGGALSIVIVLGLRSCS